MKKLLFTFVLAMSVLNLGACSHFHKCGSCKEGESCKMDKKESCCGDKDHCDMKDKAVETKKDDKK